MQRQGEDTNERWNEGHWECLGIEKAKMANDPISNVIEIEKVRNLPRIAPKKTIHT